MSDQDLLGRIDSKLAALLAISLDAYLRETGVARPRPRSIDRLLTDAGLSAKDIAALLGKTERAVHLVLQSEREAAVSRARKTAATGDEPTSTTSGESG